MARVWWLLPKPRTREAWATWADDDWNVRQEAIFDAEWHRQVRGEPSSMVIVPGGDPTVPGYAAPDTEQPPKGLTGRARRRRALADEVYREMLATPASWPYRGGDLLMSTALPSSLDEAPGAVEALREAPGVVANARPGDVRSDSGPGGLLMRVHGPTWSLVFRLTPYVRPVLVFVDRLSKFCWQIDDDPEAQEPITEMIDGVIGALRRYDTRTSSAVPAQT